MLIDIGRGGYSSAAHQLLLPVRCCSSLQVDKHLSGVVGCGFDDSVLHQLVIVRHSSGTRRDVRSIAARCAPAYEEIERRRLQLGELCVWRGVRDRAHATPASLLLLVVRAPSSCTTAWRICT